MTTTTEPEFLTIEHISVSRYGTINECHQKYKYKYHLKVIPDRPEPGYFVYGKIVHRAAEEYVKRKGQTPILHCAGEVFQGKLKLEEDQKTPPKLPPEYSKETLISHLRPIEALHQRIGFTGETEWPFFFDLDPPHNRCVKGFIDRLILTKDNTKAFILDYKTSKKNGWRKTRANINKDLQLRTYAYVVNKTFGIAPENIRGALFYLEGAEIIDARFTQESIEAARDELVTAYKQIQNMKPEEVWGNPGNHCFRCEFSGICPFFGG
jgi:CRISPR/Cas system-associated exonuclease Cas4 (RecB family)